jgi:hypothetical protein
MKCYLTIIQSKGWRPSIKLSFMLYYYITWICNKFRHNFYTSAEIRYMIIKHKSSPWRTLILHFIFLQHSVIPILKSLNIILNSSFINFELLQHWWFLHLQRIPALTLGITRFISVTCMKITFNLKDNLSFPQCKFWLTKYFVLYDHQLKRKCRLFYMLKSHCI